jgi:hypothetical protein
MSEKVYTAGSDASVGLGVAPDIDDEVQSISFSDEMAVKDPLELEDTLEGGLQSNEIPEGAIIKVPGGASVDFSPNERVHVKGINRYGHVIKRNKSNQYLVALEGGDLQIAYVESHQLESAREGAIKALPEPLKAVADAQLLRMSLERALKSDDYRQDLVKCVYEATDLLGTNALNSQAMRAVQFAQYTLGAAVHLDEKGDRQASKENLNRAYGYIDGAFGFTETPWDN